uniref:Transmembrane protein n=1 Tax=Marseillevirus sp. TaxID=2809551 RepID=A0AA96EMK5_9VIRU|nr:hypothetical protein MarDSR_206 [Marseillevirus sp.]
MRAFWLFLLLVSLSSFILSVHVFACWTATGGNPKWQTQGNISLLGIFVAPFIATVSFMVLMSTNKE